MVLGTSHHGTAGAAPLGTTVERVIHDSACPVAVVPQGYSRPDGGLRTIGAGFATYLVLSKARAVKNRYN